MKNLKLTMLLVVGTLISTILTLSCQDNLMIEEKVMSHEAIMAEHKAAIVIEDDLILMVKEGYKVIDNTLIFDSMKSLEAFIKSIENLTEEELDRWEESIGFFSQRRNNNKIQLDPNIDDAEFDSSRIPDLILETIINSNYVVEVQGEKYDLTPKKLASKSTSECKFGRRIEAEREFNGVLQQGIKWNKSYSVFYSSVGTKTKTYRKNKNGKWKSHLGKVNTIHLFLDQWHQVDICYRDYITGGYSTCFPQSNISKSRTDASVVQKVFDWAVNVPENYFCVTEFGRVHHWYNNNYNNDCHTENEDWDW